MPLPPLKRLRKGVVLFVFLLAIFVIYRLFIFKIEPPVADALQDPPDLDTKICLLVSSSCPINVDSVFALGGSISKIYAYTSWDGFFKHTDTVFHIWYYGAKEVKKIPCNVDNFSCYSRLSSDSLQVGNWSVDTEQNGMLIDTKQFKIIDEYSKASVD